jgi:hypothetical protein
MQAELTESVQQSIRPGEMVDTYYYGETNMEKQAYPCVTNTRFVQQFSNNGQGSSQFVISPNQGVSDIVIALSTAAVTGVVTNVALPNGWGYSAVARVSVRYGSSAQYFWSGQQLLLQNLYDAENSDKRDQILALGGSAVTAAGSISAGGQNAYLYLKLPHNSIRAEGKPLPFPSDLLVQPIVVTVELLPPSACYFLGTGAVSTGIPAQFATASLQVKQEMLTDSSDLLARRVDMNQNAYTFPLMYFAQQEVQVPITGTGAQSINLTGFRAGEVRSVLLWLTQNADVGTAAPPGNPGPLYTYGLNQLTLNYNGEVFTRYDAGSSAIWALTGDTKTAQVNTTQLQATTLSAAVSATCPWVEAPFAQINMAYDKEVKLMHGKPILNAVVNLTFTPGSGPNASAWTGAGGVLHAMYIYNASLLCSRGSAEYVF